MCHAAPSQRSRADCMIKLFGQLCAGLVAEEQRGPPSDQAALAAAAARLAAVRTPRVKRATLERQRPTVMAGIGDPIMVGHAETRRLLADGAGLCSPGQRPPEKRHPPSGIAARINDALMFELAALDKVSPKGLPGTLADVTSGRLTESPFPEEATRRLRDNVGI